MLQESWPPLNGMHDQNNCNACKNIFNSSEKHPFMVDKQACNYQIGLHKPIKYSLKEELFYIEWIGFCFESVRASILTLWPYKYRRVNAK